MLLRRPQRPKKLLPSPPYRQRLPTRRSEILLIVGLLLLLGIGFTSSSSSRTMTSSTPFSLLVTLTFTENAYKEAFLQDIAPLAAYVRDHEPDTIAYQVLQSDKDPLRVLVLERYRDKEKAYLQVHRSTAAFLEFRPKLKAMEDAGCVSIAGESYVDSAVGFGDRVATSPSSST